MIGADEYYDLFNGESQQIGKLYLQFYTHARGKCFEMYVLPEGVEASGRRGHKESVEVYGVTGGQRGWTETYGWKHKGKWQEDFASIVSQKSKERSEKQKSLRSEKEKRRLDEKESINERLSQY